MAKHLSLPHDEFAIVDDEDYEKASSFQWRKMRRNRYCYPVTGQYKTGGIVYLHRLVLNAPDGVKVDHINGNVLDNRKSNLRLCTHAENMRNRRSLTGSSQFKGVYWHKSKRRWEAQIKVDNRRIFLGRFIDEEQAARVYDRAAIEHHGEFAHTNF